MRVEIIWRGMGEGLIRPYKAVQGRTPVRTIQEQATFTRVKVKVREELPCYLSTDVPEVPDRWEEES